MSAADLAGPGLAFVAGLLSVLSPCVLPLLPIILGAAASEHRLGPAALAGGVASSFVAIGLVVAMLGFGAGIDGDSFRFGAALLMIVIGVVLAVPALQARLAAAGGPISDFVERRFGGFSTHGLEGQFALGLLLGAVWSPCVGPTLGAASALAAQGRDLGEVGVTMALFGLGAGAPLIALGALSRRASMSWRERLMAGGKWAKTALGVALASIGLAVATHLDKPLEAALVAASPEWLTRLTTAF
ncbi:cytochrome c biogenesis CcdA family protein [Methylosinus sp. Sm6]|uniref:cytochrome c biogenesis CcdA family protein n=1 Tax=Methylosinus sp. Sm6 TaxID=2866948 RepID=UPI001C9973BD|nr:cytochrome c biogenesis CcdA family protein [Methylosinus sp. Sm6]MBY6243098.1 cytochrome c biogenesis CcdA family protein [Methylosinus sp. Sm6]